jgi:hypothetical protein
MVTVEDLSRSSLDEEIEHHEEELERGVSEALGISLLEVQDWYFRDNDSSERRDCDLSSEREHMCWLEEWAEEYRVEHRSYREDTM